MTTYKGWHSSIHALQIACATHGATDRWREGRQRRPRFIVEPPATEDHVQAIERVLEQRLPAAWREALLHFSAAVDIQWQLPDSAPLPAACREIFAGECRWSLNALPELAAEYRVWRDTCFNDPHDPYDAVWHGKLPILKVGNGDIVAIALAHDAQPVVYLNHEGGESNGYILGANFTEYVERLLMLGCPGAEDWQWLPFVSSPHSGLLPDSEPGRVWRTWFGLC